MKIMKNIIIGIIGIIILTGCAKEEIAPVTKTVTVVDTTICLAKHITNVEPIDLDSLRIMEEFSTMVRSLDNKNFKNDLLGSIVIMQDYRYTQSKGLIVRELETDIIMDRVVGKYNFKNDGKEPYLDFTTASRNGKIYEVDFEAPKLYFKDYIENESIMIKIKYKWGITEWLFFERDISYH